MFAGWDRPSGAKQSEMSVYDDIRPLEGFRWRDARHLKIRHFKPVYHLTMGLLSILLPTASPHAYKLRPSNRDNVRPGVNG
jgi:hypothetical protein